jgi:hypothetical protein
MINKLIRSLGFYALLVILFFLFYGLLVLEVPVDSSNLLVFAMAALYLAVRGDSLLRNGWKVTSHELLGISLLMMCWISISYHLAFSTEVYDSEGLPAIIQVRNYLVFGTLWMLVGASVALYRTSYSEILALLIVIGFGAAVLMGVRNTEGLFTIQYGNLSVAADTGDGKITHLTFGFGATMLYALAYAYAQKLRPVIFILGAAVVFPLESRSAFFITIMAIMIFEFLSGSRARLPRMVVTIVLAGVVGFLMVQLDLIDMDDPRNKRMLLASGVDEDTSAIERSVIFQRSLQDLPDQILFGDPGYVATEFKDLGAYIHNLLSAWQFFGLPVFLMFVFCLWVCLRTAVKTGRRGQLDPVTAMGFIVLIYTIIGMIIAHNVAHRLLWFSLGFWLFQMPVLRSAHNSGMESLDTGHGVKSAWSLSRLLPSRHRKKRRRRRHKRLPT